MEYLRLKLLLPVLVALGLICGAAWAVPGVPTVTWPAPGALVQSNVPDIRWSGSGYDSFEVHICTTNDPNNPNAWDSGQVWSTADTVATGYLTPLSTYYVFVRLHDASGWSGWSAYGNSFYVNGQFLNDPYLVAGPVGWQRGHQLCYNPDRNEYLVSYFNAGVYDKDVLSYYRLDGNGIRIGSEGVAIDDMAGAGIAHIAYNSARQEYLLAYCGYTAGPHQLHLQRVNAVTGANIGASSRIYSPNPERDDIAYSPTSDRYLLAFEDSGQIYGVVLDSTAVPVSSIFLISTGSYVYSGTPMIAYNSADNEFLVVWVVNTQYTWDAYAQRVRASDGVLLGSNITIGNGSETEFPGGVTYDDNMSRYLVICDGPNPGSPWGQFISSTGVLQGSRFVIGGGYYDGGMSGISWNPITREYLATWAHGGSSGHFGRRISQMGACIGEPFRTNGYVQGFGNWDPISVVNTVNNEFLICWQWQHEMVFVRRYKTFAPPAAAPGNVTNFAATPGNGQNVLTWTNPGDPSFSGTLIRFKTNGYPTGTTDGTQIYNSSGTNYTHSGLTNGVTYYYTAWAHDNTPYYASGVNASATPSATPGLLIIPQPQELTWKAGTGFLVNASTQIMANSSPDAREVNMAQQLQKKVWDTTGHLPAIVYGGSATSNVIAVGTPARCPAVNSIISTWSEANGKASKTEGYILGVKDTSIVIRGFDDPGSFYGSQTLIQLLEYFKTTTISPLFSYDYPELKWRGVYFRMKWEHDWKFTKELISEMFARYKMNRIAPEIHMVSVSHPEIPAPNENPVQLANAQDLLNFCRLHYITDIVTWYPGPPQGEPQPETCLLDPVEIAKRNDLWTDVKNYLNPQYVHTHASELSSLGCAAERAVYSNEWLYNEMLWQNYNGTYTAHGMTPLIWQDMLDPSRNGGPPMNTAGAVATMPGGMIIADWEYGTPGNVPTDYPSLDRWISYGRQALGVPYGFGSYAPLGQYYGDKENIYYWANAVLNRSGSYPNLMLGLMAFNKYMMKDRELVVNEAFEQQVLGCFPYYGEWAWNPNGRYWNPYPYGNGWGMVARQLSPARVSGFSATRAGSNNDLTWTNPSDSSFTGTYIVYRTDRFATSAIDGAFVADVSGSPSGAGSYSHVGGPAAAYYSAFSHDNVRHFSPEATSVVGVAVACLQEPFSYSNGALVGNGGWTGTATSSQIAINGGYVQIFGGSGAYQAMKAVSCNADGSGYITVTCRINGETGVETMWNLWIDGASDANFARWYGSGTTVRGRIGGTASVTAVQNLSGGWEELKVKIHPVNNTTEFFFNGNSIGIFDHSVTGVGDTVLNLRFERINNSAATGHNLYFDDLVIGDVPPPDTTPPGPVTNFTATPGVNQITLNWTNPGDGDFAGTMIRFSTAGYPGSPTGGTQVYNGTGTSTLHSGLTPGVTYYYSAFTYDGVPNYSGAVTVSGVPSGDTTPPGNVTNFTATAGDGQNGLSWTNPGDGDFAGVKIMFKTTGYPTGPTDGTQAYNGSGTSTTHTGLTNGVTYYYKAFAYDGVPNYASGAQASATPVAAPAFCLQDEFNYPQGVALVGQGGWTGNATSAHILCTNSLVQVFGGSVAKNALKTVNCGPNQNGDIWVWLLAYRGTGSDTSWNVWLNDSSGKNLARWYGSGTTARGRIGGTSLVTAVQNLQGNSVWDSLVVKIDTVANTTQFYFNGGDLGTYSHSSTKAGDVLGQIKIERENNGGAAGQYVYLDNVRVSPQ